MSVHLEIIKQRIKNPKNRQLIQTAAEHEQRLRFHTKIVLNDRERSSAATNFLNWIDELLPDPKFNIFLQFFKYPIKTVNTTNRIYDDFEKIFDGQDPVYHVEFNDENNKIDWLEYRTKVLRDDITWRTKGFDAMKFAINSVLIVDLPIESNSALPEPYYYWLDIDNVIDFEFEDNSIQWIMFKQVHQVEGSDKKVETLAFFDDESYRIYGFKGGKVGELISENPHDLGYCPAKFSWETPFSYGEPELKASPISGQLSNLDTLLRNIIDKERGDHLGSNPIYVTWESDCDYSTELSGELYNCNRGFLSDSSGNFVVSRDTQGLNRCPVCSSKKLAGPGTLIEVSPPSDENNNVNLLEAVKIIAPDVASLVYNDEQLDKQSNRIHSEVTGTNGEAINNQAVNEKQVLEGIESRTNILRGIKKNFEIGQTWTNVTVAKLRYGDSLKSLSISYGNDFFLVSSEQLLSSYNGSIGSADSNTLDMLQEQFYSTKFRNNPDKLTRTKILLSLDPLRHTTPDKAIELESKRLISKEDLMLKVTLSNLIDEFERKNGSIVAFGEQLNFDKKIEKIQTELRSYIDTPEPQSSHNNNNILEPQNTGHNNGEEENN